MLWHCITDDYKAVHMSCNSLLYVWKGYTVQAVSLIDCTVSQFRLQLCVCCCHLFVLTVVTALQIRC